MIEDSFDEIKNVEIPFRVKGNVVNHYGTSIQPIEIIVAYSLDFNMGNVLKYIYRHKQKEQDTALNKVLDYFYWRLTQWSNLKEYSLFEKLNSGNLDLFNNFLEEMKRDGLEWESNLISQIFTIEYLYFNFMRNSTLDSCDINSQIELIYNLMNNKSKEVYGAELQNNLVYEYIIENGLRIV